MISINPKIQNAGREKTSGPKDGEIRAAEENEKIRHFNKPSTAEQPPVVAHSFPDEGAAELDC